jgi:hypothetical protein
MLTAASAAFTTDDTAFEDILGTLYIAKATDLLG